MIARLRGKTAASCSLCWSLGVLKMKGTVSQAPQWLRYRFTGGGATVDIGVERERKEGKRDRLSRGSVRLAWRELMTEFSNRGIQESANPRSPRCPDAEWIERTNWPVACRPCRRRFVEVENLGEISIANWSFVESFADHRPAKSTFYGSDSRFFFLLTSSRARGASVTQQDSGGRRVNARTPEAGRFSYDMRQPHSLGGAYVWPFRLDPTEGKGAPH
jgi:hypothetical protein